MVPFLIGATCQRKTEVIEVYVPVYRELVIPKASRPILMIDLLTEQEKQNDGEISKAYVGTVYQLLDYIQDLESILLYVESQNQTQAKEE